MMKFLKKVKCKVFVCCKSKCTINDTNNNGIPDELTIENLEEHDKSEMSYAKKYKVVVNV